MSFCMKDKMMKCQNKSEFTSSRQSSQAYDSETQMKQGFPDS